MGYFTIFDQFGKVSTTDKALVDSIRSLKTIRPVGRGVAIEAKDVVAEMQELRRKVMKSPRRP